jgi:trk system potassium uptake protein TrkH
MFIGKKINLSDRIIIKESLNQESFSGMVGLIKRIFKYTFIFELIGVSYYKFKVFFSSIVIDA